jgi:hypothetical protein
MDKSEAMRLHPVCGQKVAQILALPRQHGKEERTRLVAAHGVLGRLKLLARRDAGSKTIIRRSGCG